MNHFLKIDKSLFLTIFIYFLTFLTPLPKMPYSDEKRIINHVFNAVHNDLLLPNGDYAIPSMTFDITLFHYIIYSLFNGYFVLISEEYVKNLRYFFIFLSSISLFFLLKTIELIGHNLKGSNNKKMIFSVQIFITVMFFTSFIVRDYSKSIAPEGIQGTLLSLTFYLFARILLHTNQTSSKTIPLTAICIGAMISTKYDALVIILPFILIALKLKFSIVKSLVIALSAFIFFTPGALIQPLNFFTSLSYQFGRVASVDTWYLHGAEPFFGGNLFSKTYLYLKHLDVGLNFSLFILFLLLFYIILKIYSSKINNNLVFFIFITLLTFFLLFVTRIIQTNFVPRYSYIFAPLIFILIGIGLFLINRKLLDVGLVLLLFFSIYLNNELINSIYYNERNTDESKVIFSKSEQTLRRIGLNSIFFSSSAKLLISNHVEKLNPSPFTSNSYTHIAFLVSDINHEQQAHLPSPFVDDKMINYLPTLGEYDFMIYSISDLNLKYNYINSQSSRLIILPITISSDWGVLNYLLTNNLM